MPEQTWTISDPVFDADQICPQFAVYPWNGHRNFAYDLARFVRPSRVVELGTQWGTSFFAFCQAVKDTGLQTQCVAVDTWKGDENTGAYGEDVYATVKQIIAAHYADLDTKLLRMTFDAALAEVDDDSVDILHIDGCHFYEAIKHDFETWLPKVRENGVVLFHDVAESSGYGSAKYWNELQSKYAGFKFDHSWGLGVLFPNGGKYYDAMRTQNLDDRIPLYEFKAELALSRIKNDDLSRMVEERDALIERQDVLVRDRDEAIAKQTVLVDERDDLIRRMERRIADLGQVIVSHEEYGRPPAYRKSHLDIAFLLGYPEISGGTNVILEHALGLTRHGHNVSIVTELPFDPQRLSWKPDAMSLPLLCHADCREREFDVAVATWWRSVYDLPFIQAHRYAYFCQSIESRFFSDQERDIKALVDYTYRQPLAVVTEASWIANYLHDRYEREVALVLNGIDKSIFNATDEAIEPRPKDGMRVLVEGSIGVPFKRIDLALQLCKQAHMDDVWLLTPSPCENYPGADRVLSRVPMPEVGRVYRSCDVLVKLSTVEGMFGPPLEMMHCGGTAITSDVSGHEEYMRHGENGLVVPRGEEAQVVDFLQRLADDRPYLDKLKAGALQTAAAWPDWSKSVEGMEAFIRNVATEKLDASQVNTHSREHLRAALQLAEPLRLAIHQDFSGRELLDRLKSKVRRKIKSKFVRPRDAQEVILEAHREAIQSVNGSRRGRATRLLDTQKRYRICFLGDQRRFGAHVPSNDARMLTQFVHADRRSAGNLVQRVSNFGPDVSFVLSPENFDAQLIAALPGVVAGYSCSELSSDRLNHYRRLFGQPSPVAAGLFHMDTKAVSQLIAAKVNVLGTFLLPTDRALFGCDDSFDGWCQRDISVLYVGPTTPQNKLMLERVREVPGFLQLTETSSDAAMRPILANARMVLHFAESDEPYLHAAKIVRDMMSGCLVIGQHVGADYGLMAGEHYHFFDKPSALFEHVTRETSKPDRRDVVRRNSMELARRFDAAGCFLDVIERYLCQTMEPAKT